MTDQIIKLPKNAGILVFDLEDSSDQEKFYWAQRGLDLIYKIDDLDEALRNCQKHGANRLFEETFCEEITPEIDNLITKLRTYLWEDLELKKLND